MKKFKNTLKKWNSVFCSGMTCKANAKRDILIVPMVVAFAAAFLLMSANPLPKRQIGSPIPPENNNEFEGIVAGEEAQKPVLTEKAVAAENIATEEPVDSSDSQPKQKPPASPKPKKTVLKSSPSKPRISAPKPVSFKVVGGRLVCANKNDKPRKSKKNKGKHLDMECCLDPDEYPNPWCAY